MNEANGNHSSPPSNHPSSGNQAGLQDLSKPPQTDPAESVSGPISTPTPAVDLKWIAVEIPKNSSFGKVRKDLQGRLSKLPIVQLTSGRSIADVFSVLICVNGSAMYSKVKLLVGGREGKPTGNQGENPGNDFSLCLVNKYKHTPTALIINEALCSYGTVVNSRCSIHGNIVVEFGSRSSVDALMKIGYAYIGPLRYMIKPVSGNDYQKVPYPKTMAWVTGLPNDTTDISFHGVIPEAFDWRIFSGPTQTKGRFQKYAKVCFKTDAERDAVIMEGVTFKGRALKITAIPVCNICHSENHLSETCPHRNAKAPKITVSNLYAGPSFSSVTSHQSPIVKPTTSSYILTPSATSQQQLSPNVFSLISSLQKEVADLKEMVRGLATNPEKFSISYEKKEKKEVASVPSEGASNDQKKTKKDKKKENKNLTKRDTEPQLSCDIETMSLKEFSAMVDSKLKSLTIADRKTLGKLQKKIEYHLKAMDNEMTSNDAMIGVDYEKPPKFTSDVFDGDFGTDDEDDSDDSIYQPSD